MNSQTMKKRIEEIRCEVDRIRDGIGLARAEYEKLKKKPNQEARALFRRISDGERRIEGLLAQQERLYHFYSRAAVAEIMERRKNERL